MGGRHRLLYRQLRRAFGSEEAVPEALRPFLGMVEEAYQAADEDRALLERALDLTSTELMERYEALERELEVRERMERALREGEARVKAVLGGLPDPMLLLDREGRVVESFLPHGQQTHVLLQPGADELVPMALEALHSGIQTVLEGGGEEEVEFAVSIDGQSHRFEARLALLPEQRVLAVFRDVSELRRVQEHLSLAERMSSVGTLAAGVAHEINNPLTYVIANLEHLAEELAGLDTQCDTGLDPDVLESLSEAWRGTQRVRRIVSDLRTFSRQDEPVMGPVDLHGVVDAMANLAAHEVRHCARLIKHYGSIPLVEADDSRLGQVIINLLVNAAQAIPTGRASENLIRVRTWSEEGWVFLSITDTGRGIPEEAVGRIFDPFFTTKAPGVGSGLGLSISRSTVRSFGGRLELVRTSPEGTEFLLSLRPCEGVRQVEEPSPALISHEVERSLDILVIDDESEVARALQRALRDHQVEVARGGRMGLEILRKSQPDLVLCDLLMPELTGMELYRIISEEAPGLARRFVFMTGGAASPEAARFLREREGCYLEKPFDLRRLREVLAQAARR